MVKGISRQVIVVQSPDPKLFEQAIFILKDEALKHGGISDEALLKEAGAVIRGQKKTSRLYGPAWACAGALTTAAVWALTAILRLA